jgi:diguanylate cyclase (GGDEF)-like protein
MNQAQISIHPFQTAVFILKLFHLPDLIYLHAPIATRLLESANKHPFYKKDRNIFLRLSIGIATTTSETKLNDLISLADKALYKAKQNGKNTVEAL